MKQETFPITGCCSDERILQHLKNTKDHINNQDFKKDKYKFYAWNETYFWGCKSYSSQRMYDYFDLQHFISNTMRKENYFKQPSEQGKTCKIVSGSGILKQFVKKSKLRLLISL